MTTLPAANEATRQEIEAAVRLWRVRRQDRLDAEKVAAKIKAEETHLKEFIVSAMLSQSYEGTVVNDRLTYVRVTPQPVADDRQAFEQYILDTKDLSLLQFRPAVGALKEHIANGEIIPGITWVDTYDLGDKKA
jgi:hypothetical protein